jgi:hypothetical protein
MNFFVLPIDQLAFCGDVNVFLNIRDYIHLLFRVIIDWSYYLLELFLAEVFLLELLLTGSIIDRRHY